MCIATATSSHVAAMKSSPRHASGAKPMACSTPSTRPHCSAERVAHGVEVLGHGDVELEHLDLARQLAGRALGQAEATAGAGEHDARRPARCASSATPNASDASVSTPVITIFLPSSRPMRRP